MAKVQRIIKKKNRGQDTLIPWFRTELLPSRLKDSQIKGLSEFLNTVAAAWFSAGAIYPLFASTENPQIFILYSGIEIIMAVFFLSVSLLLLKEVKL